MTTANKRATLNVDAIQRLQGRAIPHTDPVAATVAEPAPSAPTTARKQVKAEKTTKTAAPPSRVGKVAINVWTSEPKRRALKSFAVAEGLTLDELMTEALDDLMRKRRIRES